MKTSNFLSLLLIVSLLPSVGVAQENIVETMSCAAKVYEIFGSKPYSKIIAVSDGFGDECLVNGNKPCRKIDGYNFTIKKLFFNTDGSSHFFMYDAPGFYSYFIPSALATNVHDACSKLDDEDVDGRRGVYSGGGKNRRELDPKPYSLDWLGFAVNLPSTADEGVLVHICRDPETTQFKFMTARSKVVNFSKMSNPHLQGIQADTEGLKVFNERFYEVLSKITNGLTSKNKINCDEHMVNAVKNICSRTGNLIISSYVDKILNLCPSAGSKDNKLYQNIK